MSGGDHPRIRGEHVGERLPVGRPYGSSPHTRGARSSVCIDCRTPRIIPAYAGSTTGCSGCHWRARDHPRIRGEHFVLTAGHPPDEGSSPHTRGARRRPRVYPISSRIIPAYAGSTASAIARATSTQDHPRIRGEHRGRPRVYPISSRIIPAYAGSTGPAQKGALDGRDHPRIRGEHIVAWMAKHENAGSSPHTRGAPPPIRHPSAPSRIIPAYAGSTLGRRRHQDRRPDHPRIRGEHPSSEFETYHDGGSSPHTRGARCRCR